MFGDHVPGRTDIWESFKAQPVAEARSPGEGGIGTPDQLRSHLRTLADTGVDQIAFIQQGGRNKHEHICDALKLFAREVMPEFHDEEQERQRKKTEELAPFIEAAMKRKVFMQELADEDIPSIPAFGRKISEGDGPVPFNN